MVLETIYEDRLKYLMLSLTRFVERVACLVQRRVLLFLVLIALTFVCANTRAAYIAYDAPLTNGNQTWSGALGMQFDVNPSWRIRPQKNTF